MGECSEQPLVCRIGLYGDNDYHGTYLTGKGLKKSPHIRRQVWGYSEKILGESTMRKDTVLWKNIIITVNAITGCLAISPTVFGVIFSTINNNAFSAIIAAIVVCLEITVMMLGKMHEAKVERDIFGWPQKKVLEEIKPQSKNELERARAELRMGIKYIMIPAVLLLITLYFAKRLAWNLAIAAGLVLVIAFIYADYLPHVNRYLKDYDSYYVDRKEARSARGMARIYFDEWKKCGLKDGSSFYKEIENEAVYREGDDRKKTKDYIACVFAIRADLTDSSLTILGFSMLVVNIMTATSRLYELLAGVLGAEAGKYALEMFGIMAPMVFMVVSICQTYEYYAQCYIVNTIWRVLQKDDFDEMVELYNRVMSGAGGKLSRVWGAFVYTQTCMEREHDISYVPLKYRMLFPHKYIANKVRYRFTYWLAVAIVALVMLEFEWMTVVVWAGLGLCAIILYPMGLYALLPKLNRRKVHRECAKLEQDSEKGKEYMENVQQIS